LNRLYTNSQICCLTFDEISIRKQVEFDGIKNREFVDLENGYDVSNEIAVW
jgi:hypothetical protein